MTIALQSSAVRHDFDLVKRPDHRIYHFDIYRTSESKGMAGNGGEAQGKTCRILKLTGRGK